MVDVVALDQRPIRLPSWEGPPGQGGSGDSSLAAEEEAAAGKCLGNRPGVAAEEQGNLLGLEEAWQESFGDGVCWAPAELRGGRLRRTGQVNGTCGDEAVRTRSERRIARMDATWSRCRSAGHQNGHAAAPGYGCGCTSCFRDDLGTYRGCQGRRGCAGAWDCGCCRGSGSVTIA